MFELKQISSHAPWESVMGYSRAIRYGNTIEFSGTVCQSTNPGDEFDQMVEVLSLIESYLMEEGGTRDHIVRTRIYCMHIDRWPEIAKAHKSFFGEHRPATTLVQVSGLIEPKYLVEVEATAVIMP